MKRIKPILTFLSLVVILTSCENPTKDISLHISPQMYKYVMEVGIHDFADPDAAYTGEVQIEITGPDADKIYNVDGTKNYEANYGRLLLITDASGEPVAGSPLEFTVKLSSNEYMDKNVDFLVANGQTYVSLDAYLINRTNLPQGLVSSSTSAGLNASGELDQPLQFSTNPAGFAEPLTINIPSGVKFKDADGNTLSGSKLNIDVISYDGSQAGVNLAMPNGGLAGKTVNGESIISFIPAEGIFDINMDIDGHVVKGFTGNGVNLNMPIHPNLENPSTQQAYVAGDAISLMSFSDGDKAWQDEGVATVIEENSKLWVKPNISHLSSYAVIPVSLSNRIIKITDNTGNRALVGKSIWHIDCQNGNSLDLSLNMMHMMVLMVSGALVGAKNLPEWKDNVLRMGLPEQFVKLGVTDQMETGTGNVPVTFLVSVNGSEVTYDPMPKAVEVGYTLRCKGEEATYKPPFGSVVQFRPAGSSESYKDLYTFTFENAANKLHELPALEDGQTYDFRFSWFNIELFQISLTIEDGKIYELELTDKECSDIGF